MSKIRTALVIFLLSSSPVYAASIDEAGALKLKESLQKMLNYQKSVNEAFSFGGDIKVIYTGDMQVTPQTDFYAVTFPKISVAGETEDGKEDVLDFGTITMNAIPTDNDNEWKVMTSLPQTMTFGDGAFEINIGGQTVAGLYNDAYGLTKMNLTLQDMTFKTDGVDSGVKIGTLKYISNLEQDASDKTFSGPSVMSVENFSFNSPDHDGTANVGEIRADVSVTKLYVPTIEEMATKLQEYAKVLENVKKTEGAPSQEDLQKFADFMFDVYQFKVQSFDAAYTTKNVKVVPASVADKTLKGVALTDGLFGLSATNMQSDSGDFGIKLKYSGLALDAPAEDLKVPPTEMNLDLKAAKIPYNALMTLATSTYETVKTNPEMGQMAGLTTLFKLPAILAQAGANITIADTYAKGAEYNATLTGNIVADMNAMTSVTAKLQGMFAGLDNLIDAASKSISYTDLVSPLSMIKEFGAPTTQGGVAAYSYDIEMAPDGRMLINGKDIAAQPAVPAPDVEEGEAVPDDATLPQ